MRTMRATHHRRCRMTLQTRTLAADAVTELPATRYVTHAFASPLDAHANVEPSPRRRHRAVNGTGADSSMTATMMLVVVVGIFLLVEVPLSSTSNVNGGRLTSKDRSGRSTCAQTSKCRCPCFCCSLSSRTRSTSTCLATQRATLRHCSSTVSPHSRSP